MVSMDEGPSTPVDRTDFFCPVSAPMLGWNSDIDSPKIARGVDKTVLRRVTHQSRTCNVGYGGNILPAYAQLQTYGKITIETALTLNLATY